MMVAYFIDTNISLGSEEIVCVTIIVKTIIMASIVPIFDFVMRRLLSVFCFANTINVSCHVFWKV